MEHKTTGMLSIIGSLVLGMIVVPVQSGATSRVVSDTTEVYWISPSLRSLQGEEIPEVKVGSPVVLHLDVRKIWGEDHSDVLVFEVRDVDIGFTYYLGFQSFVVDASGNYVVTASWLPSEPGEYMIRSFALSAITGPDMRALTMVHESPSITVVSPGSVPPTSSENETKTFLIGYKLAITPEDAHMVSIEDFSWLRNMIENGEAMVSVNDKNRFLNASAGKADWGILMAGGTIIYYNINYYEVFLIPNTSYVKAYWLGEMPEDLGFLELDISDNASLKDAVADYNRWVPVKGEDGTLIEQLVEENTRYVKVLEDDGTTGFYEIRYIGTSQEKVN